MKLVRHGFTTLTLLLLSLVNSTFADYCLSSNNCCAFNRYAQENCNGAGTSPVTDFVGESLRNKDAHLILGISGGLTFVGSFFFQWQKGFQANGFALTTYGFVINFPASNCSREVFYFLSVLDCPYIMELTSDTPGFVPNTNLRFNYIYKVCYGYKDTYYPAPCTVLDGVELPNYQSDFNALNQGTKLFMSGLRAIRVKSYKSQGPNPYPRQIAKKYDLDQYVEEGNRAYTFTVKGSSRTETCGTSPYKGGVSFGQYYIDQGYSTTDFNRSDSLCKLATRLSTYSATRVAPSVLWFRLTILVDPYDFEYQINILIPDNPISIWNFMGTLSYMCTYSSRVERGARIWIELNADRGKIPEIICAIILSNRVG